MSVVGLGLSYAASRAVVSQRYLNTQNLVISQLRESLSSNTASLSSMCTGGSGPTIQLAGSTTATSLQCQKGAVTIGVADGPAQDDHARDEKAQDDNAQRRGNGATKSTLTVSLPASSVVTSLTVATPANDTNAALVGGDGKIAVSL